MCTLIHTIIHIDTIIISASNFHMLHLTCSCKGHMCSLIHTCTHFPQLQHPFQHPQIGSLPDQRRESRFLWFPLPHSSIHLTSCCICSYRHNCNCFHNYSLTYFLTNKYLQSKEQLILLVG